MNDILVIYHKNCTDGLGAALVVYEWLKTIGLPQLVNGEYVINPWDAGARPFRAFFMTAQYGDNPPVIDDIQGKDVYILDFSYPRRILLEIEQRASKLVVIDHHKTAQEELKDLDFCIFDMDKSGCVLTWEYFFPDENIPLLFSYLEDRDLWKWELFKSKEVNAALRSYKPFFDIWEHFLDDKILLDLQVEGEAILRYQQQQIDMTLSREPSFAKIGDYEVPCINSTTLISEIGNELSKDYPFAACYFDTNDGKRVFSLRSQEDSIDVSEIAKQYGGGGHKHAAGFTVEKPKII